MSTEMTHNVALYRTSDSIDSLKIKLRIRETSRVMGLAHAKRNDLYTKEFIIGWQEKLQGPGDIAEYIKHREYKTKPRSAVDQEHFRFLALMESEGTNVGDLLEEVMLYTYTDRDHYSPEIPPPIQTSDDTESYLGAAISGSGLMMDTESAVADARQRKIRQRVFKEKPYKVMHVCLATDVQVAKLRDEKPWSACEYYKEHVLFTMRMYNDGLIEMAPEFSRVLEEDEARAQRHGSGSASNVFISNKTVAQGIKKGLRLHTYRLRSEDGSEFEYSLENMNEYTLPSQVEAVRATAMVNDALRSQATRSLGTWKMDPPADGLEQTVSYMAEIVSGTGFEGDELFVAYHISTPPEWRMRTGDLTDGTSEDTLKRLARGEGGNKRVAAIAATVMEMDGFDDGAAARGALQGTTQTSRARATRGDLTAPILRPKWKGKHLPYSFDGFSRFVWGCSFFLLTVITFLVGLEYPFWLIPCLIFTFGLGTGYPGGPVQACLREPEGVQNRVESRSAKKVLVGQLVALPVACFNHLVSMSFDRRLPPELRDVDARGADNNKAPTTSPPSAAVPTIVFQVYSRGLFGRVSLEGYGYQHLPTTAGSMDVVIRTWRPLGGISSQMTDFFLGSSVRLHDPNFVDMPRHLKLGTGLPGSRARATGVLSLNRFGVSSETSGEIRFRCHVVTATPSHSSTARADPQQALSRTRSLDEILKSAGGLGLSVSGSLATLGGSGRFTGLAGLGGSGMNLLGAGGEVGSSARSREADSASLARRAELLLAQAKTKVAALSALGATVTGAAGVGVGTAEGGVVSKEIPASRRVLPSGMDALGFPTGLPMTGSLLAESKEGPGSVRGSSRSKGSKSAGGGVGRYSDSEDENAGLLRR